MAGKHRREGGRKGRGPLIVLGYALNVGVVGLVTLLSIPLMISIGGVDAWAAAAVGQSVGVIATVVIGYGWAISGPALVAKALPGDYITIITDSIRTRLVLLIPAVVGAVAACFFLIPNGENIYSVLGVLSTALLGLRFNWFLIGLSKPYVMLLTETFPRIASTVTGLVLMYVFGDMTVALIAQIVGLLLSTGVSGLWVLRYVRPYAALPHPALPSVRESLLSHRFGMSAATVSAMYSSGPLILIGFTSPTAVGTYAVLDRIIKQLFTAASPVVDALRGWVPRPNSSVQRRRAKLAIVATAAGAVFSGLLLFLLGIELVRWFSDGQIAPSAWTMGWFGLFFATSLFSMVLGQVVLVSFNLVRDLFFTSILSSAVGLLLAAILSIYWNVSGVLMSLIIGHLVGIARNAIIVQKHLRPQGL